MLIPTINGDSAHAVLEGIQGRPQLAVLGGARDVAQLNGVIDDVISWATKGVAAGADVCKTIQAKIHAFGGYASVQSALSAMSTLPTVGESAKSASYWLVQLRNDGCTRLGIDVAQPPPGASSSTNEAAASKLRNAVAPMTHVMSTAQPAATLTPTPNYPAGTITAESSKRPGTWRIAIPRATGLGMFGDAAAYTEVATSPTPPPGATQVPESDFNKQTGQSFFRLDNPWMWAAIAGGAIVIVGGLLWLLAANREHKEIAARSRAFERALLGDHDYDSEHDDAIDVEHTEVA